MAPKKQHEIQELAANIHEHCADRTQLIIDLGSGLGYLSEALFKLNDNYMILGLEADEKRVRSARIRSQQLLSPETHLSISYQQLFVTAAENCRSQIEQFATELARSKGLTTKTATTTELSTTLIGLHACADLSINAMLLFLSIPQVQCLHIMPCCYHKLALTERGTFQNFPLSRALRSAMSADEALSFNRPFMRLACQQTNSRWRCDALKHTQHGTQMWTRALASALCDANELVKVKRYNLAQNDSIQNNPLYEYVQQRFQLHSQQTGDPLDWRAVHEQRFAELTGRYSDGKGARLAEALCCLQATIQQLCENVVLYDRLCYLQELAAVQHLSVEVRYEKLFDEKLSPRCRVLIAEKL
ncbi:GH20155 [Drosophila grimshawi]|uniref:GH20155 n=2 Tax=Drosophila grimshawi TaxID=7222 RepID=B4J6H5_DROGR|nr:GH20155 [Drosophila grimshawi]